MDSAPSPLSRPTSRSRSRFTSTTSMNFSSNPAGQGQDRYNSVTADELLQSISYLEKDAALQRVNEELEKKSHEIFQKIEQYYSRKCVQNSVSEAGDANPSPVSPVEKFQTEKSAKFHNYEDSQIPVRHTQTEFDLDPNADHNQEEDESLDLEFDYDSVSTVTTNQKHAKSRLSQSSSESSILSSNFHKKTESVHGKASPDTKDVDIKARKRLQKATESVVSCLQSKLVSHEARLSDLYIQFRQKIQENTMLEGKIRALEDDREKLVKSLNNLQVSAEKSSKGAELARNNLQLKTQAFAALKKDVDTLRRDQKQKAGVLQNLQTRLNRCLEENDKLKQHNRSLQQNYKDKQTEDRLLIEELSAKVGQLEQQKAILNATIGKQGGLVKTLRQQLK